MTTGPLIEEGLNPVHYLLVVLGGGDVEVHVPVPDVTVADHAGGGPAQPLPHHRHAVVEHGQRQRDVVLRGQSLLQHRTTEKSKYLQKVKTSLDLLNETIVAKTQG